MSPQPFDLRDPAGLARFSCPLPGPDGSLHAWRPESAAPQRGATAAQSTNKIESILLLARLLASLVAKLSKAFDSPQQCRTYCRST